MVIFNKFSYGYSLSFLFLPLFCLSFISHSLFLPFLLSVIERNCCLRAIHFCFFPGVLRSKATKSEPRKFALNYHPPLHKLSATAAAVVLTFLMHRVYRGYSRRRISCAQYTKVWGTFRYTFQKLWF